MTEFFLILTIIIILLIYNQIYFLIYKEKVVFFKYFQNFIIYSLIIVFIFFLSGINIFEYLVNDFYQSIALTYFIMFMVLFFNISTRSYESPTVLIYNIIKGKGEYYKNILNKLNKKKLVEIRIRDLINQKLLIKKDNKLYLSELGKKFSKFYLFLKNFYKIKSQG